MLHEAHTCDTDKKLLIQDYEKPTLRRPKPTINFSSRRIYSKQDL